MKIFFILLFCLSAYLSSAQSDASGSTIVGLGSGSNTGAMSTVLTRSIVSKQGNKMVNPNFENIKGSAYITDFFQPTKLYYDGEFMKNVYYRYNAYNQEIEIKQSSGTNNIAALNKDKKIAVLVDDNKMGFKTFVTSTKKTLNGYLIELLDGNKYDLFRRDHIIYSQGRVSTNSFVKAVPNKFTKFTEYYFQKEGVNRIDEIKLKNSQLLKLLDDSTKKQVKEYIKVNHLNIKKEADLIKVFDFLNK